MKVGKTEPVRGSASDVLKDTLETKHTRERRKKTKNSQRVFFLVFRLNRKLCIFLCTECTDAILLSLFAFFLLFKKEKTSTAHKQNSVFLQKRTLSCFIVCVHHWMGDCYIIWKCWMGSRKKSSKKSFWGEKSCAYEWRAHVGRAERKYVCRLHEIYATCNLHVEKILFKRKSGTV